jgi:hypothetical protein
MGPGRASKGGIVARRRRRFGAVALLGLAGVTIVFGVGQTARADDAPTTVELLQQCNVGTDYCVFHPDSGPEILAGESHQVGTMLFNCGPGSATKSVSWTDSSAEWNSVGISFVHAEEGGLLGGLGAFKSEFEVTYGHRWGTSDTTTRATDVKVASGNKGWLERAAPMQRISGTYELHFGSKFHGHYYWYVPFIITAAAPAATNVDVVSQREQTMTTEEKAQCGYS